MLPNLKNFQPSKVQIGPAVLMRLRLLKNFEKWNLRKQTIALASRRGCLLEKVAEIGQAILRIEDMELALMVDYIDPQSALFNIDGSNLLVLGLTIPSVQESIDSVAHELIHARQLYSKKIQSRPDGIMFDGEFHDTESVLAADAGRGEAYRNLPWEKEAFAETEALSRQIMRVMNGLPA